MPDEQAYARMTPRDMVSAYPVVTREPRPRQRSRYGCRNCKLRKLKCDESKPCCRRCSSFGVLCNFAGNVPDLQPVADDALRLLARRTKASTFRPPVTSAVWTSDADTTYQLNAKCQDYITRYLARSLPNRDGPNMAKVNRALLNLTFIHPYLMHASLAVAFAYDRHLDTSRGCRRRSLEECYHWSESTVLFNRRIRQPIQPEERDSIWGTAAALALLTFSCPDACSPEESWPLKPSDPSSDLEWLRMNRGKMSLWRFVNPLRPDSLFSVMAPTYAQMDTPLPERGIDGMLMPLASVCELDDSDTTESSPFFSAAHAVSMTLDIPESQFSTGHSEIFTRTIRGHFKSMLLAKDPVALLLLYLWYRKSGRSIWWIGLRARIECPAICSYLRTYHHGHAAIEQFLPGGILADCCG